MTEESAFTLDPAELKPLQEVVSAQEALLNANKLFLQQILEELRKVMQRPSISVPAMMLEPACLRSLPPHRLRHQQLPHSYLQRTPNWPRPKESQLMIPLEAGWGSSRVQTRAVVDSGAASCFMDMSFVQQHDVPIHEYRVIRQIKALDGQLLGTGVIEKQTLLLRVQAAGPDAIFQTHRLHTDNIHQGPSRLYPQIKHHNSSPKVGVDQKKLSTTVGTLPQLEKPAKKVVLSNVKPQYQSDSSLPNVTNVAISTLQHKEERQRGHQFSTKFISSVKQLPESFRSKNLINKERFYEGLRLPLLPIEALKYFKDRLTEFEQEEILDYSEIWYLRVYAKKSEPSRSITESSRNDEEDDSYIKVLHDHISYRYEVLEVLGKGSFGQVFKCLDHKNNELVAIKVIRKKR
ncbi:hypothetical protein Z043_115736 [Scleropages formosus]|uniref:dual-specificity kinase n=1 Tax=Scleropages formosus TaxID=113540 RepID=A0A0P7U768_SCLFO|nr:hypothetical protein Z043_115736 [Scleropages formosus]